MPSHSDSDTVEHADTGADTDPGPPDSGPVAAVPAVDSAHGATHSASSATDRDSDANDLADPDLLPED